MAKLPTFEDDLDQIMRTGFGRRFLARYVASGMVDTAFNADTNATYFNLGLASKARQLDEAMRQVNPDCWLLMHRELIDLERDSSGPAAEQT